MARSKNLTMAGKKQVASLGVLAVVLLLAKFACKDSTPHAVFLVPVTFASNACKPMATLRSPVVFACNA